LKTAAKSERFFLVDAVRILTAILLPPVSVFLTVGATGHFWLSIVLTLLGFLPGMVHAIWLLTVRGLVGGGP
jgi:uncharacterized membrane protein YqaE (UPF0057 family)